MHRSSAGRVEQGARALEQRPSDYGLAVRLIRGLGPREVGALLGRFERHSAERPDDFAVQLGYAQLLLAARSWPEATRRFARAAELSPGSVAPRWGRARALGRGGNARAAVSELRAALGLSRGSDEIYRLSRELVTASVAIGDVESEVEARGAWARARPSDRVTFELALALGRAGRPAEAADALAAAAGMAKRAGSDRARWALAEGRYRAAAGDLDRAWSILERARRDIQLGRANLKTDLRREIWVEATEIARRRGALGELKEELGHPRDAIEWVARARVSDEQGDLRDAWRALDEAVRLTPRDIDLRLRRIAVARRVGTTNELVGLYEDLARTATGVGGQRPAVASESLDALWRLGRPEVAGRLFDKVLTSGRAGGVMLRALAEAAGRWSDDRRAERAWRALLRRNPRDEMAVIALGEAQFQRGQRRLALDTWRTLLHGGPSDAKAHVRLGEVLGDHDLQAPALVEAQAAIALLPDEARHHRLMATILERQGRTRDAEGEWETVLRLARGPARVSERREARTRLVALWIREGSARVDMKLRELEQNVRVDRHDREALTFLVEAELRSGRTDAAIAMLKTALSGGTAWSNGTGATTGATASPDTTTTDNPDASANAATSASAGTSANSANANILDAPNRRANVNGNSHADRDADADADADLILLLVRTLRQVRRSDEAMAWLEELAHRFPGHALDARLQLADIALAGHADQRAQIFADQAAADAPGDPRVVLRVAAVQERLGHFDQALGMYRRLVETEHDPGAALALGSLLARLGEIDEQRVLLRQVLRGGADDETIAEAGRRAIALEEATGTLEALESYVADAPDLNAVGLEGLARRRVLASILARLVPTAYQNQWHERSSWTKLQRFARHGVRPLLDLISAPDAEPDIRAVEILGMLGRPEAVPELARLVAPDLDPRDSGPLPGSRAPAAPRDDLASVVVIALGRLGGDGARAGIEAVEKQSRPTLKLPVLWALGRVGGSTAVRLAKEEISRATTDSAVIGCLTLGRAGGGDAAPLLLSVARDAARAEPVRVAAIFGLVVGRHVAARPMLFGLADSGDPELTAATRSALDALGRIEDGARQGLVVGSPVDEAAAIQSGHIDPGALLESLEYWSRPANRPSHHLWRDELVGSPNPVP